MSRLLLIAATVTLAGILPALAAGNAPFPMAADGTTNIADCGKVDAQYRNECISRSRPVSGKQIYSQLAAEKAKAAAKEAAATVKAKAEAAGKTVAAKAEAAGKAVAAKAEKAEKAVRAKIAAPEAVRGAPKGFKIAKDGTTNIADCAKAHANVRNECISRARPLTGKELSKFLKTRQTADAKASAKAATATKAAAAKPVEAKPVPAAKAAAAAPTAPVTGKGFKIAKDGTTDINDCAKANPDFRNECISRSRPVPGSKLYATKKP